MKAVTQLTIGTGCGALAALIWFAAYPPALPDPGNSVAGSVSEPVLATTSNESPVAVPTVAPSAAIEQAFLDPDAFFARAESARSIKQLIAGLEILIATDPERVFDIAARFHGTGADAIDALYLHAIRGMVDRDPLSAITRLQGLAVGPQRGPILAAIGAAYAVNDADAALRWALSVTPAAPDAIDSVLETVASTDLLQAYNLLSQARGRIADIELLSYALARAASDSRQSQAAIASALAARGEPEANRILGTLLQGWTIREPENVIAWMNGNEAYLNDDLIRSAVYYLAFYEVTVAAELTAQVPAGARQAWLAETAYRYGQFDIAAALEWLPQHQNQPGYTDILNRTLLGGVQLRPDPSQPPIVARFIASTNADIDSETILRTGYAYADADPQAATQWAVGLSDPEDAAVAAAAVADIWAGEDGPAAQRWALELPRGELRDEVLGSILTGGVFYDGLDRRALVEGFSSPAAAQESIHLFLLRDVVNRDEVTAESEARIEWMLERLTDPELKRNIEERIAAEQ